MTDNKYYFWTAKKQNKESYFVARTPCYKSIFNNNTELLILKDTYFMDDIALGTDICLTLYSINKSYENNTSTIIYNHINNIDRNDNIMIEEKIVIKLPENLSDVENTDEITFDKSGLSDSSFSSMRVNITTESYDFNININQNCEDKMKTFYTYSHPSIIFL